jgi:hypothetical protein
VGRSFTSLADEEFNQLFLDFRYTAFRLETLQVYDVFYEKDEFARFLDGAPRGEFPGIGGWIEGTVAKAVAAGKHLHRVHVVEEPLSDYVRFECAWAYEHTVEAGEDVRLLAVGKGEWPGELPRYDYWLFDSSQLVAMLYEKDGTFRSAEIVDDPEMIVRANLWRDAALHRAVSYREFAGRYDARLLPPSG